MELKIRDIIKHLVSITVTYMAKDGRYVKTLMKNGVTKHEKGE